jgi:hypothetical protein
MRFAQNGGINFAVPNAALGPSFRANAYDLADPVTPVNPPPYGDIHPRYKEQVGYRLAVAALPVLFPGAPGTRIAPVFTNCSVGQNSITTTYTNGGSLNLFWNTNAWIPGFDVRDATNTWYNTTIVAASGNAVSVAIPTGAVRPITGVRYAWQVCGFGGDWVGGFGTFGIGRLGLDAFLLTRAGQPVLPGVGVHHPRRLRHPELRPLRRQRRQPPARQPLHGRRGRRPGRQRVPPPGAPLLLLEGVGPQKADNAAPPPQPPR